MNGLVAAESALIITLLADWQQTLVIAHNPSLWHEYNKILGSHPSPEKVDVYFVSVIAALVLILHFMPEKTATELAAVLAAFETVVVLRNYKIGL